ncbi:hypothetical protein AMAG_03297 [Allomyces macrogynus ATCC 38327]|uniref:Fcf2 pre-rRNA processing C-terminal domain-containing protein n=1 Tax=Allomyces macrogynus (strain ATCC 38327) TaxID=578462 RepID=A0A0L0S510_ALLM3|nr:hypothetical protein AMAG_03297 [Allomyces macrogynus ATCC 38327]|eukprot:KNE57607.1 hypothetical protein AMAG_03297 [Allomyces macrogynus ATCC 38327]
MDLDALLQQATANLEAKAAQRPKKEADILDVKFLKLDPHLAADALTVQPNAKPTDADLPAIPAERKLVPKQETRVEATIETAGDKWFNLPATEITPELQRDLFLIKNRHVLDPKRHYKKDAKANAALPKFFQVGRIVEGKHEFYSSRLTRKERKNTLIEELLADTERRTYFKNQAKSIVMNKAKGTKQWYKLKKMQKKKGAGAW